MSNVSDGLILNLENKSYSQGYAENEDMSWIKKAKNQLGHPENYLHQISRFSSGSNQSSLYITHKISNDQQGCRY